MTAWVDIPPLLQRATDCRVCRRVLDIIAHEATRLREVRNLYRLSKLAGPGFSEGEVRGAARMLHNAGLIEATIDSEKGRMKSPVLTDAGWGLSSVPRPFWMDGRA